MGERGRRRARATCRTPTAVRAAVDGIEAVYYLAHAMGGRRRLRGGRARGRRDDGRRGEGGRRPPLRLPRRAAPRRRAVEAPPQPRRRSGTSCSAPACRRSRYQAGVVIGSGSTSFEMIRHLTDVLPWMPAPRWVRNRIQPIAVRDVLYYLVGGARHPGRRQPHLRHRRPRRAAVRPDDERLRGRGEAAAAPDRVAAGAHAAASPRTGSTSSPRSRASSRRRSSSRCSSSACSASTTSTTSCRSPRAGSPRTVGPCASRSARCATGEVETSWRSATLVERPGRPAAERPRLGRATPSTSTTGSGTRRRRPRHVWSVVESIGGENGWYSFPLAWVARGWMDKLVGGVGLNRGRRDPKRLEQGDALDWWRVERLERGRYLRLRAEFKSPGRAWLEMTVTPTDDGGCDYRQRAIYFPQGLAGRLYWYGDPALPRGDLPRHGRAHHRRRRARGAPHRVDAGATGRSRMGSREPAHEEAA